MIIQNYNTSKDNIIEKYNISESKTSNLEQSKLSELSAELSKLVNRCEEERISKIMYSMLSEHLTVGCQQYALIILLIILLNKDKSIKDVMVYLANLTLLELLYILPQILLGLYIDIENSVGKSDIMECIRKNQHNFYNEIINNDIFPIYEKLKRAPKHYIFEINMDEYLN